MQVQHHVGVNVRAGRYTDPMTPLHVEASSSPASLPSRPPDPCTLVLFGATYAGLFGDKGKDALGSALPQSLRLLDANRAAESLWGYGRAADPWWAQSRAELDRIPHLSVTRVADETVAALVFDDDHVALAVTSAVLASE